MTKFFETYCLSDVYKNIINNLRASCVNKVKRILPIFLITFFFIQVVSCGRTNKRSQSLYNLHEQCYWLIYHNDYDSLKQKAELFLDISRAENDKNAESYAYICLAACELTGGKASKAKEYLNKAQNIAINNSNDTIWAYALNLKGIYEARVNYNIFSSQQCFYKSKQLAEKAANYRQVAAASINLGALATLTRDTSFIKTVKYAYEYGRQTHNMHYMVSGAQTLSSLYQIAGNPVEAKRYLDIAISINDKYNFHHDGVLALTQSYISLDRGEHLKALNEAKEAIQRLGQSQATMLPQAWLCMARIYMAMGDYRSALESLKHTKDVSRQYSSYGYMSDVYELMAQCYYHTNSPDEALEAIHMVSLEQQSSRETMRKQLSAEHALLQEMAQKENVSEMRRLRLSHQIWMSAALGMLALCLFSVIIYMVVSRRRREKLMRSVVASTRQTVAAEDKIDSLCLGISQGTDVSGDGNQHATSSDKKTHNKDIYDRLCRMMIVDRLYADKTLTRESVIERLGTNRTYFTQLLQENCGMNYSQFIASYRVKEAIRLLSDSSRQNLSVQEVCSMCGFGSTSSFYKTFQASTGVTPVAFRKFSLKQSVDR